MDRIIHRRRWVSIVAALACGLSCQVGQAATWPVIRAIGFQGNRVTRDSVMERELFVSVGGPADPVLIAKSRQAILDLGLFLDVSVEQKTVADGVALTFVVREKWYILPVPHVNADPNGSFGYGGQLRWNNVWGLNHTLNLNIVRNHYNENNKSGSFGWQGAYGIPFVDDSHYGLNVSGGHALQTSKTDAGESYQESFDNARVLLSRSLSATPRSLGWRAGAGLTWHRESASGIYAPPSQGKALGLIASVTYNALSDEVYSEHGTLFSASFERDFHGLMADYNASLYTASYLRAWDVGATPYQEARLLADIGVYSGGPDGIEPKVFALGGSREMRGYSSNFAQGDFSYYVAGEFLRPIGWKWLRALVFVEAGSVHPRFEHTGGRPLYVDVGAGLRVRVAWLVNIDLQAGIAVPLVDRPGGRHWRAFAGSL